MSSPNSFILHAHYEKQLKMLTIEQRGLLITALFDYHIEQKVPEMEDPVVKMAFSFIAEQMDYERSEYEKKCEQNRRNINKRWSSGESHSHTDKTATPNTTVHECLQVDTKPYLSNSNSNSNSNSKSISNSVSNSVSNSECEGCSADEASPCGEHTRARAGNKKQEKNYYGQYGNVRLTDGEIESLRAEFSDLDERIERLSEYIASVGDRYKSHAATIRAWSKNGRDGSGSNPGCRGLGYGYGGGKGKKKEEEHESSFDFDEFFEAALARSQRYLEEN